MKENEFRVILNDANGIGIRKAKASLPKISVSDLVQLTLEVLEEKKTPAQAAEVLASKYMVSAESYAKTFADIGFQDIVNTALEQAENNNVQKLSKTNYSKRLETCTLQITKQVWRYCNGEINAEQLIHQIGKSDLMDLATIFMKAEGIEIPDIRQVRELSSTASFTISYVALSAAYQIAMEALDDAHAYHEESKAIQAECDQTAEMIAEYRSAMEKQSNGILRQYAETFSDAFATIDNAILEDDVNGYIKGNEIIQKALGREVQYTDEDSFEALMNSDIPFKF